MAKTPQPGMGQDEKDRLGQQAHEAFQRELLCAALAPQMGTWLADDALDAEDLTQDDLAAEAERRRVTPARTKAETVKRLRARRAEVEAFVRQREAAGAVPPTGQ